MEHAISQEPTSEIAPAIRCEEETDTYGRFVAEPLESGFGITLGNALRRVLLRALPGAAVVAVRIEEAKHEFSTLPGVKEDVIDFLLNLKEIRLRPLTGRPGRMILDASGEGRVSAGDIQTSADFEIVNPELHLATLNSPETRLSAELHVGLGKGYSPAELGQGQPLGIIPVDAIFSPVRRVNYNVEPTRVGQATNYDKLTLEVWTDNTISPSRAISLSASILSSQFSLFLGLDKEQEHEEKPSHAFLTEEQYEMPLETLNLQPRTFNSLRRAGIIKVGQIVDMTPEGMRQIRHFGEKSLAEVMGRLREMNMLPPEGLNLTPEVADEA
ncbi:MAG: DNA-directed RNA polymerase subunit alpha [Chloroflexi bacterium]|nr:DNA-directed RNA polymerase subunit alpha [Chloroflexota bacterium]